MDKHIEVIARGLITRKGKILLCKVKEKRHWFLPGGHVELGENARIAFQREMMEEIGEEILAGQFIGINENRFGDGEGEHQEVNILFEASLDKEGVVSHEDHLEFRWLSLKEFSVALVLPESMKKSVSQWLEDKRVFHSEQ